MAFSLWQKMFAIIIVVVTFIVGQIIILRTCSSQTIAVLFRIEIITVIESVMLILSLVVWKTFVPLLTTALSRPNQSSMTTGQSGSYLNSRPLMKSKNSESDLSVLNSVDQYPERQTGGSVTVKLGKIILLIYLGLCHTSYLTNLFLLNTDPHWLSMLAYSCFGSYIQLLTGLGIFKLLSLIIILFGKLRKSHTSLVLSNKNVAVLAFVYMVTASTCGLYTASQPPNIKHVTVKVKDLPSNLEGLNIVQLSDIHLGPTVGFSKVVKIVEIVNKQNADIIVLTGDLVDGTVEHLHKAAQPLQALHSKYGNFFVTGNHEYYTGDVDNWFLYLQSLGFTVLHNSNVKIPSTVAAGQDQICIAGTDDVQADRIGYKGHTFDLAKAVSSCSTNRPVILLAHQPYAAKMALESNYRIDLVLSGHTHGGQMFPLIIGAYLINPFYAGLYQYGDKGGYVYVSQGTQYWGIPMRIGTSMEITRITLHKAA